MWFNEECKTAQEEKDKVRVKVLQNHKEDNKMLLVQNQKNMRKAIRGKKKLRRIERV